MYAGLKRNLRQNFVERKFFCTAEVNCPVGGGLEHQRPSEAFGQIIDKNRTIFGLTVAGHWTKKRGLAHDVQHLRHEPVSRTKDHRGPQNAIRDAVLPHHFFGVPFGGLVGRYAIGPHSKRRHLDEPSNAVSPGCLCNVACTVVMDLLEGSVAVLDNDADEVYRSVTALEAFAQAAAFDHVSVDQFYPRGCQMGCLLRATYQRADIVALGQQPAQHMSAYKARCSRQEDLHSEILNVS